MENTQDSSPYSLKEDLSTLIKLRLNTFVLITTFFGFLLGWKSSGDSFSFETVKDVFNTVFGTALAAFGSAVFNQLMEIESDARMARTANRPLPSKRIVPPYAFAIGWGLCAVGLIHLGATVSMTASLLTAITIGTYVFVYTPLKRFSSLNTLVGAIPGAIPPMIGWVGAGQPVDHPAPWFLFSLLFLWQLPHFVSINWLCREEYEAANYKMWSDRDQSGKRSAILFIMFSILLALLPLVTIPFGLTGWVFSLSGVGLGICLIVMAQRFIRSGERLDMRKAFFATLIYLPFILSLLAFDWN